MGYRLGIDLGTTFSSAAVVTDDGRVTLINLGGRAASIPSVVLVRPDGAHLVGDAAEARAASDPTRVARGFKRRIGDPTPLLLGGTPFSAEALTTILLGHIVHYVARQMGEPAAARSTTSIRAITVARRAREVAQRQSRGEGGTVVGLGSRVATLPFAPSLPPARRPWWKRPGALIAALVLIGATITGVVIVATQVAVDAGSFAVTQQVFVERTPELVEAYENAAVIDPSLTGEAELLIEVAHAGAAAAAESISIEEMQRKIFATPNIIEAGVAAQRLDDYAVENCGFTLSAN